MPTGFCIVRLLRMTGSDRCTVKVTRMTLNGHRKWSGAANEFEIWTGWRSWNDAETVKSDVPNRVLDQFLPTKAHTDKTPLPKLSALQSASS
jgi:hypothetical protein